ncbi:MBL fold metallo-hydrolase [Antarcticirhabdus aurantiaca]|uniref:MBL fold metallo-hydrolase n=1 Tax=Antarcticirhabdus aurantiaca TaxID=2606717 RepID=A0ACD4NJX9_9HYPH|nr:MBL fold metallo-hydrolase [Antarcticirhabdus aurantiaca]WAJ27083.1 MBL fold metallo-hydrolase [Jeongeuplla avenae]
MIRPLLIAALLAALPLPVLAQGAADGPAPSTCLAVADAGPNVRFARIDAGAAPIHLAQARTRDRLAAEVRITYAGHSTYLIESPEGVLSATDFNGVYGGDPLPRLVTMNKAHSSHNTPSPDPGIEHVLRGWSEDGNGPARHAVTVGDVYVRNVPTDIRGWGGGMEPDGNSIFIFEIAGLCIGHLGHLHHTLTEEDYAAIGRLDVLMVPVDGGMTMSQEGMGEIAERLHASIVLPMHRFRGPIDRFLDKLPDFAVDRRTEPGFSVSVRSLPAQPTVIVLAGV